MTAALSALAVGLSLRMRSPALVLFLPIFGGIGVQMAGWPAPDVPPLASAAAFALVGWHIGLSFTPRPSASCARLVPRILLGIVAILLLCMAWRRCWPGWRMSASSTAYMALNLGGADVVAGDGGQHLGGPAADSGHADLAR